VSAAVRIIMLAKVLKSTPSAVAYINNTLTKKLISVLCPCEIRRIMLSFHSTQRKAKPRCTFLAQLTTATPKKYAQKRNRRRWRKRRNGGQNARIEAAVSVLALRTLRELRRMETAPYCCFCCCCRLEIEKNQQKSELDELRGQVEHLTKAKVQA